MIKSSHVGESLYSELHRIPLKTKLNEMKKTLFILLFAFGTVVNIYAGTNTFDTKKDSTETFTFWQLPSQSTSQMMSYVIKTSQGKIVVIDGGASADGAYLKSFLNRLGGEVSAWFLTHEHYDHVEAFIWNLQDTSNDRIKIKKIYANFPTVSWIEKYEKQYAFTIKDFNAAMTKAKRKKTVVNAGDEIDIDEIKIEILYVNTNTFKVNAINNSSLLIKFSDDTKSVLFTGDLGEEAGNDIIKKVDHRKLKSEYVQMAHHGQAGIGKNLYELINASYYLWPTPLWLWNNDNGGGKNSGPWKTLEVRKWVEELQGKGNYVSGNGLYKF